MLVSAGFDAHERDPLAGMRMTTEGYGRLTSLLLSAADELCAGRIVFVTEGGYDTRALVECIGTVAALASGAEKSAVAARQRAQHPWRRHREAGQACAGCLLAVAEVTLKTQIIRGFHHPRI